MYFEERTVKERQFVNKKRAELQVNCRTGKHSYIWDLNLEVYNTALPAKILFSHVLRRSLNMITD